MKTKKSLTILLALVFVMGLIGLFIAPKIDATIYGSISGQVTGEDTGKGVSGIKVFVDGLSRKETITDREGKYSLQELKPGKYLVEFYPAGPYCHADTEVGGIVVEPGKIIVLNRILKVGGAISGTVYKGKGLTSFPGVFVLAGKKYVGMGGATSGKDGRYLIPHLIPSDNYEITADCRMPGYANKILQGALVEKAKETQGIDIIFDLDDDTGIEGTITSSVDGKPLPGIDITVRTNSSIKVGEVVTDENGYYSIRNLDPGTYYLWAFPPDDNLTFQQWSSLSKKWEDIIVTKGNKTRVDLILDVPSL